MTIGRVVDVSSAQHPNNQPIDWVTAKHNGVTTALVKATQGTTYLNPWFHVDANGAKAAGLDVLAYHFADFTNATAEAQWFMANAGPLAAVGDFETSTNVPWMRTFLQALGRPWDQCLGYGSASTFRSVYQQIPALPWVAAYGQGYPGWGVLWQFTSGAQIPGIPTAVDESSWHGSQIQYDTLFGVYAPPGPPIEEDQMFWLYTTNTAGTGYVIEPDLSSKRGVKDGQSAGALIATGLYKVVTLSDAEIANIPGN